MNRVQLDGALYAFALPDGGWGALYPGSHIQTSDGRVELPGEDVLALVGTRFRGRLCMAGQGQRTGCAWLLQDDRWRAVDSSFGVSPCAFGDGVLCVAVGMAGDQFMRLNLNDGTRAYITAQIGTQGLRYVNGITPVSGDATYRDGELFEWTKREDITVGQGHFGGALLNGMELEPGDCRFIRFDRTAEKLGVAIVKLIERCAVLHFLSVADTLTLPAPTKPPIDPPVDPPVDPVEPPMSGITDAQFATLVRLRNALPEEVTPAQIGALLNEWAWTHRAEGCGMESKPGSTTVQPRTNRQIWNGARFAGNIGQDVLGSASIGIAKPTRGTVGPAVPALFVAPVEPLGTVDPPNPLPVDALVDTSRLVAEIAAIKAAIAIDAARIKALEDRPTDRPPVALGGKFALRTDNGHYITADGGGGGNVVADRIKVGDWEIFTLEPR